ncbi:uncharacterized protein LAESUDRAFT_718507 [Laetiporus sulphureus 93-53]|uniref:Uncharacterized protein n=1 Tax=Laetiporus sulphureus 93-53 TaxID=1314785 RepID=A0A165AW53_9APHY|nr:uncharacterized protein LAESUDRAFT_718507 [Laetiporus sulphureus 93-53]KZS99772.1 hypothetical protein LAESUDRAFT_718507 [Laetiporus sulphureus 93-53]
MCVIELCDPDLPDFHAEPHRACSIYARCAYRPAAARTVVNMRLSSFLPFSHRGYQFALSHEEIHASQVSKDTVAPIFSQAHYRPPFTVLISLCIVFFGAIAATANPARRDKSPVNIPFTRKFNATGGATLEQMDRARIGQSKLGAPAAMRATL